MFNLNTLKEETVSNNRYKKRISKLVTQGQEIERIKKVVEGAIANIAEGKRSFVIYGEPQSGKTEMMIALTARLLDEGRKIVVVLLNDSVQLLGQNLERFQRSGLSPSPKKFSEVLPNNIKIGEHSWVIFSKKNARDLEKLKEKLRSFERKVIIDDEADYATPNTRINQKAKSKINELTEKLIGTNGVYIGVTATPARLDLNRTHNNNNECWIDFQPHSYYAGQEIFFPSSTGELPYILSLLPDQGDYPKYLRKALFSFMVNVAYLNSEINEKEENYSFLIHTSGKTADHTVDYKEIVKTFEILRDDENSKHKKYFEEIWKIAHKRYPDKENELTKYIIESNDRNNIVVMNSDKETNVADNGSATQPTSPFTVAIGGNIVSRGVTFDNLLSMFFTRDVKHNMQQDTYIQRARMFGARNQYLEYFELTIPEGLYLNWQRCFIFHRLSLESRRTGNGTPVWLEGKKLIAASRTSIDKASVVVDSGEMSFEMFDFDSEEINDMLNLKIENLQKIKALSERLGKEKLPEYLIRFIENFMPSGGKSIAIHGLKSIEGYKDAITDQKTITRTKGFIGKRELELTKYPDAIHHIYILFNGDKKARVFYNYQGSIKFLKTTKRNDQRI